MLGFFCCQIILNYEADNRNILSSPICFPYQSGYIGLAIGQVDRGYTMSTENSDSQSFESKVQEKQDWIESQFRKVSRGSWARILRMARKPTPQEFKQTVIICGIGLFVLGAIGFAMLVLMDNFIPYLIHDVFNIGN